MFKRVLLLCMVLMALVAPVWALGDEEAPQPLTQDEYLDKALTEFLSGDYGLAIETLSVMLDSYPNNAEAYLYRGYAYQALARQTLALDDFTRAISLRPYDWTIYLARGDAFIATDELDNGLRDYQTSIDLNPRFEEGYTRLSQVYNALGNRDRSRSYQIMAQGMGAYLSGNSPAARRAFDDVLERVREDDILKAYAYYGRGLVNFNDGDLDAAIRDVTNGAEFYEDMHDLYLLRGIVYRIQGNLEGAGEDFYRRMTLLEDPTRERVTLRNGEISAMDYGVVDVLEMTCAAGSTATISAVDINEVGVDALITVLDPSGTPIAGDDDFGGGRFDLDSLITDLPITSDDTYTILVSHANGGYTGDLRVSYLCAR